MSPSVTARGTRSIHRIEAVEYSFQLILFDTDSRIRHRPCRIFSALDRHRHFTARRVVLHGVGHKIGDKLVERLKRETVTASSSALSVIRTPFLSALTRSFAIMSFTEEIIPTGYPLRSSASIAPYSICSCPDPKAALSSNMTFAVGDFFRLHLSARHQFGEIAERGKRPIHFVRNIGNKALGARGSRNVPMNIRAQFRNRHDAVFVKRLARRPPRARAGAAVMSASGCSFLYASIIFSMTFSSEADPSIVSLPVTLPAAVSYFSVAASVTSIAFCAATVACPSEGSANLTKSSRSPRLFLFRYRMPPTKTP